MEDKTHVASKDHVLLFWRLTEPIRRTKQQGRLSDTSSLAGHLPASGICRRRWDSSPGKKLEGDIIINLEKDTVLVQSEDLQMQIKANGVVQPIRKINISPKEAGRIIELLVREGDRVQSGQTIARMDDEQLQAQVNQYRGVMARVHKDLRLCYR